MESNCAKVILLADNAKTPMRASAGAAGYDLYSIEDMVIPAGKRTLVRTGIVIEIPHSGLYARIAPRSGLSLKGIDVGAGVIDSDYRGEVKILLINNGVNDFSVKSGDRIAQMIFEVIVTPLILSSNVITSTERAAGGFGSTGC